MPDKPYFNRDITISTVKSTLMIVHKPCPISFMDAPNSHTSSSIIR